MKTGNTTHDAASYDCSSYQRGDFPDSPLTDANALYRGFRRSQRGSQWKEQVQRFELNWLSEIAKLQTEMQEYDYHRGPYTEFVLHERGKTRVITGEHIRDRTLKHVLCDDILLPAIQPKLIHDNGASIQGKGIDFTRRRLVQHLTEYYRLYGNKGYVLLMDYSKFYDNIRHEVLKDIFFRDVSDPHAIYLVDCILRDARIDVSYLSPEDYAVCMDKVFNSLEYRSVPHSQRTGERYMDKHLDIGDQLAQIAGISYPSELDSYIKVVRGVKFYARYMDDSYIFHPDRGYLQSILADIVKRAAAIGITVNQRKTFICPISQPWRFLQIQYVLTDTGRVIQKVHPKSLTRERQKMKKLAPLMDRRQFRDWFFSWYNSHKRHMSLRQKQSIFRLYNELEESQCIQ